MRHTHFFCFLYTIRRPFDRRRRTRTLHSVFCALLQVQHKGAVFPGFRGKIYTMGYFFKLMIYDKTVKSMFFYTVHHSVSGKKHA